MVVITNINIAATPYVSEELDTLMTLHQLGKHPHLVTVFGLSPDPRSRLRVLMEPMICNLTVVLQVLAQV